MVVNKEGFPSWKAKDRLRLAYDELDRSIGFFEESRRCFSKDGDEESAGRCREVIDDMVKARDGLSELILSIGSNGLDDLSLMSFLAHEKEIRNG